MRDGQRGKRGSARPTEVGFLPSMAWLRSYQGDWLRLDIVAGLTAAVVVVYSVDLIKPAEFVEIGRVRRIEFSWAVIAFIGVVLLGTLKGILVAVIVSLLALAQQAYNAPVYEVGRKRGTDVYRALSYIPQLTMHLFRVP